jgi:hypothetical protein
MCITPFPSDLDDSSISGMLVGHLCGIVWAGLWHMGSVSKIWPPEPQRRHESGFGTVVVSGRAGSQMSALARSGLSHPHSTTEAAMGKLLDVAAHEHEGEQ